LRANATELSRAKAISGGVNFLTTIEQPALRAMNGGTRPRLKVAGSSNGFGKTTNRKDDFIKEAMLLRQALSLTHHIGTSPQFIETSYFRARMTTPESSITVCGFTPSMFERTHSNSSVVITLPQ